MSTLYLFRYNEDGAQVNFIRDTETNSSCPCKLSQALKDYGRFMPHPRCSTAFRDVTCSESLGAHDCYMSAQNIFGSYSNSKNSDGTRYMVMYTVCLVIIYL